MAVAHGRSSPYDNYVLLASSLLHGHIYIDALWRDDLDWFCTRVAATDTGVGSVDE